MSEQQLLTLLERIDRALLAEIDIIRDGRFQELRTVQQETAAAMRALDQVRVDLRVPGFDKSRVEGTMARVAKRAEQARGLIGAALHGARNARMRLETLIQSDGDIGTYDRDGGQMRMKTLNSPYNKTL
jgi:hypothetical protein